MCASGVVLIVATTNIMVIAHELEKVVLVVVRTGKEEIIRAKEGGGDSKIAPQDDIT